MKKTLLTTFLLSIHLSFAQVATTLRIEDTRNITSLPTAYGHEVKAEFKPRDILGVPGTGNYSGLLTIAPWSDNSGNKHHQLNFNDGGIFYRNALPETSQWGTWRQLLVTDSNGNVGIGTTTPGEKLEIINGFLKVGNVSIGSSENQSSKNYVNLGSDNHGTLLIGSNLYLNNYNAPANSNIKTSITHPTMSGAGIIIPGNGQEHQGSIIFHTSPPSSTVAETEFNSPRMIIKENGNIGIGIQSPIYKLDVNGVIHSKEVKVDMIGWADYVFQRNYPLRTLEEVEQHIEENGHLPNIPSTEEVLKNGINLAEMNTKLLEKIEELTLYSIEQNKQIKKLQNENKLLKSQSKVIQELQQQVQHLLSTQK